MVRGRVEGLSRHDAARAPLLMRSGRGFVVDASKEHNDTKVKGNGSKRVFLQKELFKGSYTVPDGSEMFEK